MAFNFDNQGAIVGQAPTMPNTQRPRLNLPSSARWWFIHHPARWQVMDGELLPRLGRLSGEPGVGGVDKHGDTAGAEISYARRGWKKIPWELVEGGYLRRYDGRGGDIHLSIWEHPKQIANRTIVKTDREGFKAFLRGLISSGFIEPADPDLLEGMAESLRASIVRAPGTAAAEQAAAALAVIEAALNPPAPKKGKRNG